MKRLPWLERLRKSQREQALCTPLPLSNRSNGEYFHEHTPREKQLETAIFRRADESARKLDADRRQFLASSMGMATALSIVNLSCTSDSDQSSTAADVPLDSSVSDAGRPQDTGRNGYDVGTDTLDANQTCQKLSGDPDEFVFDIQTHHINADGPWRQTNPGFALFFSQLEHAGCGLETLECFGAQQYIEQIFLNSDTTVAVLSTVPAALCDDGQTSNCGSPLTNQEIIETREIVNALAHSERVVNHCMVLPNAGLEQQLAIMDAVHSESKVAAWKCYPPWGPKGTGWRMDDPKVGLPFIEKGVKLGVPVFCIHKGFPLPGFDTTHTDPEDVGIAAKAFPDASFVVYHSGFRHGSWTKAEGAYDPADMFGTNTLVKTVLDNELAPGSNVYAELGSVWGNLISEPDQAAHVLGKLLKYVGENNVVWGTDCIWTGSPQPQIEAFRAFQISQEFQEKYGYPALTPTIKAKILGLNAAAIYGIDATAKRCAIQKDDLARARADLDGNMGARRWTFTTPLGPRTRREFLRFQEFNEGKPG